MWILKEISEILAVLFPQPHLSNGCLTTVRQRPGAAGDPGGQMQGSGGDAHAADAQRGADGQRAGAGFCERPRIGDFAAAGGGDAVTAQAVVDGHGAWADGAVQRHGIVAVVGVVEGNRSAIGVGGCGAAAVPVVVGGIPGLAVVGRSAAALSQERVTGSPAATTRSMKPPILLRL